MFRGGRYDFSSPYAIVDVGPHLWVLSGLHGAMTEMKPPTAPGLDAHEL